MAKFDVTHLRVIQPHAAGALKNGPTLEQLHTPFFSQCDKPFGHLINDFFLPPPDTVQIDLGLTNRVNPDETQLRLAIELRGLGGLGSSALDYQTPGLAGLEHGETVYGRYGW